MFPVAPEGGGYLVLNAAQISSLDLLCLIKRVYPRTRIIAQQMIPARLMRESQLYVQANHI